MIRYSYDVGKDRVFLYSGDQVVFEVPGNVKILKPLMAQVCKDLNFVIKAIEPLKQLLKENGKQCKVCNYIECHTTECHIGELERALNEIAT